MEEECESNSQYTGSTKSHERFVDHGHIKLTKSLGGGGYGKVYEAKNIQIEDGKLYAIKEIQFFDSAEEKSRVTREVMALATLDHPNIVRYYRSWFEDNIFKEFDAEHDDSSDIESSASSGWPKPVQPFSSYGVSPTQESNSVHDDDEYTGEDDSVCFQHCASAGERNRRYSSEQNAYASRICESELQTAAKETAVTEKGVECCDKSNDVARTAGRSREVADESSSSMSCEQRRTQSRRRLLLFIQMELCAKGTLKMYLQQRSSNFDRRKALEIFCQTAKAVEYIHSNDFIHRDLKPSNIFFAADYTVKIGDFGLVTTSFGWCVHSTNAGIADTASAKIDCRSAECRKHTDDVGTELYMSPEQVDKKPYDNKVDIYALGLVFFELMYHFSTEMERGKTLKDVRKRILPERFEAGYPEESTFVKWLLEPDPTKRPSINDICDSTYLVTLKSKIFGCSGENDAEIALTCSFCQQTLSSPRVVRSHLASRSHAERVATDDDKSWLYRDPPCGISEAECIVCDRSRSGKAMCRFGDQCVQAHSDEERQEWKSRIEYRIEKALRAKKEADALLKRAGPPDLAERMSELLDTEDNSSVLSRALEGVDIQCNTELHITKACKKCENCWEFKITTTLELQGVALRKNDEDGTNSYFYIESATCESGADVSAATSGESCREWSNNKQLALNRTWDDDHFAYIVKIKFKTLTFGSFHEYVAFSFGELNDSAPPFVVRELRVEVKAADITQKQTGFRHADGSRWDASNTTVRLMPFNARSADDVIHQPTTQNSYSAHNHIAGSHLVNSQLVLDGLKKENYKDFFHELLRAELLEQDEAIARYNLCTHLRICRFYEAASGGIRYCSNGELFAKAELGTLINDDSFVGRLLRQTVTCVYLAPLVNRTEVEPPEKAYEAIIEETGQKWILVRLSRLIVQECKLSDGMIADFQVQFSPYSQAFSDLHWAVDALSSASIVFPNVEQVNGITACNSICTERFGNLNKEQLKAISCINSPRNETLPPVLLLGPFGTGKTFTLAKAALYLASSDPDARLLLCTHSNSAADIYVRDYFDPEIGQLEVSGQSKPSSMLVRIYYANRRPNTVDPVTLKYCLFSQDGCQSFRMPTIDDLKSARFVVSTLMAAKYLSNIPLPKDFFTHIFIDEAAQAMEPEALIPLALATNRTRIVLAGDHMQMNPEIFSSFAMSHCLHISLIERLHDLYTLYATNCDCKIKIMLCENYRSHTDIVKFASKTFYGGSLKVSGKQAPHSWLSPLCFFNVEGTDEPSYGKGNLGYYNNNEVLEVADVIDNILKSWPSEWGNPCEEKIGVVAPYTEQVFRIRLELRRRKHDKVSVERIFNVQGKEFRVLVISTVRTTKTCSASDIGDKSINYAFLTDAKLLNTALTRAQSLVAVVGDAKSLCTVGRCRTIWNAYIETCSKSGSLRGVTLNEIQGHLLGIDTDRTRKIKKTEPSTTIVQIPVAVTPPMLILPNQAAMSPLVQGHHIPTLPIASIPGLSPPTADNTSYGLHARMPVPTCITPPQIATFILQQRPYPQAAPLNTLSSMGMPALPLFGQPVHGNLPSSTSPTSADYLEQFRTVPPVTMPYGAYRDFQQHNFAQHLLRGDDVNRPPSALRSPHRDHAASVSSIMPQQFPEHTFLPSEPDVWPLPLLNQSPAQLRLLNLESFPRAPVAVYWPLQQTNPYVFLANTHQWQASPSPGHPVATGLSPWYYSAAPPAASNWAFLRPTTVNANHTKGVAQPPPGFAPLRDNQFLGDPARVHQRSPLQPPPEFAPLRDGQLLGDPARVHQRSPLQPPPEFAPLRDSLPLGDPARVHQRSPLQPRTRTGDTPAEAPIRPRTLQSFHDQRPVVRPSNPVHQRYAQPSSPNYSGAKSQKFNKKK